MLHNIGFFMLFKNFMQHKIAVLCNIKSRYLILCNINLNSIFMLHKTHFYAILCSIKSRFKLHKMNDFMQHKFKLHKISFYAT